jgi:hypothetical protein
LLKQIIHSVRSKDKLIVPDLEGTEWSQLGENDMKGENHGYKDQRSRGI